jgi:DNA-binding GntR family transcriptional regulator
VIDFDQQDLEHLFLVREALEGMAARLAAERMTAAELKRLRELLAHHSRQPELAAGSAYYQRSRDDDYHFTIVRSARCERLEKMLLDEVYYQLRIHRLRSSTRPGRAQQALTEHREILNALVSRNPDAAEGTMRRHIRNARLSTLSTMAQDEAAAEPTRALPKARARA